MRHLLISVALCWLHCCWLVRPQAPIVPGYLDFDNLPETNFSCQKKVIGGYYADIETGCQMFHVCTIGQKGEVTDIKFLCLNGTVFDQETRVCERVDEVDCSQAEGFFDLNLELYGSNIPFGFPSEDEGSQDGEGAGSSPDHINHDGSSSSTSTSTTTSTTTTTAAPTTTTTTKTTTTRRPGSPLPSLHFLSVTTPRPHHSSTLRPANPYDPKPVKPPPSLNNNRFPNPPAPGVATLLAISNNFNNHQNGGGYSHHHGHDEDLADETEEEDEEYEDEDGSGEFEGEDEIVIPRPGPHANRFPVTTVGNEKVRVQSNGEVAGVGAPVNGHSAFTESLASPPTLRQSVPHGNRGYVYNKQPPDAHAHHKLATDFILSRQREGDRHKHHGAAVGAAPGFNGNSHFSYSTTTPTSSHYYHRQNGGGGGSSSSVFGSTLQPAFLLPSLLKGGGGDEDAREAEYESQKIGRQVQQGVGGSSGLLKRKLQEEATVSHPVHFQPSAGGGGVNVNPLFTTPASAVAVVSQTSSTSFVSSVSRVVHPPSNGTILGVSTVTSVGGHNLRHRQHNPHNLTIDPSAYEELPGETTPPTSYDEYLEGDVQRDPFYLDVPRIGNKKRNRREATGTLGHHPHVACGHEESLPGQTQSPLEQDDDGKSTKHNKWRRWKCKIHKKHSQKKNSYKTWKKKIIDKFKRKKHGKGHGDGGRRRRRDTRDIFSSQRRRFPAQESNLRAADIRPPSGTLAASVHVFPTSPSPPFSPSPSSPLITEAIFEPPRPRPTEGVVGDPLTPGYSVFEVPDEGVPTAQTQIPQTPRRQADVGVPGGSRGGGISLEAFGPASRRSHRKKNHQVEGGRPRVANPPASTFLANYPVEAVEQKTRSHMVAVVPTHERVAPEVMRKLERRREGFTTTTATATLVSRQRERTPPVRSHAPVVRVRARPRTTSTTPTPTTVSQTVTEVVTEHTPEEKNEPTTAASVVPSTGTHDDVVPVASPPASRTSRRQRVREPAPENTLGQRATPRQRSRGGARASDAPVTRPTGERDGVATQRTRTSLVSRGSRRDAGSTAGSSDGAGAVQSRRSSTRGGSRSPSVHANGSQARGGARTESDDSQGPSLRSEDFESSRGSSSRVAPRAGPIESIGSSSRSVSRADAVQELGGSSRSGSRFAGPIESNRGSSRSGPRASEAVDSHRSPSRIGARTGHVDSHGSSSRSISRASGPVDSNGSPSGIGSRAGPASTTTEVGEEATQAPLPVTSFTCADKVPGGYYADLEADCQLFHICSQGRHGRIKDNKFLCGPGTRFNQQSRTCQAMELVDCQLSASLYHLNNHFHLPGVEDETLPDLPEMDFEPHRIARTRPKRSLDQGVHDVGRRRRRQTGGGDVVVYYDDEEYDFRDDVGHPGGSPPAGVPVRTQDRSAKVATSYEEYDDDDDGYLFVDYPDRRSTTTRRTKGGGFADTHIRTLEATPSTTTATTPPPAPLLDADYFLSHDYVNDNYEPQTYQNGTSRPPTGSATSTPVVEHPTTVPTTTTTTVKNVEPPVLDVLVAVLKPGGETRLPLIAKPTTTTTTSTTAKPRTKKTTTTTSTTRAPTKGDEDAEYYYYYDEEEIDDEQIAGKELNSRIEKQTEKSGKDSNARIEEKFEKPGKDSNARTEEKFEKPGKDLNERIEEKFEKPGKDSNARIEEKIEKPGKDLNERIEEKFEKPGKDSNERIEEKIEKPGKDSNERIEEKFEKPGKDSNAQIKENPIKPGKEINTRTEENLSTEAPSTEVAAKVTTRKTGKVEEPLTTEGVVEVGSPTTEREVPDEDNEVVATTTVQEAEVGTTTVAVARGEEAVTDTLRSSTSGRFSEEVETGVVSSTPVGVVKVATGTTPGGRLSPRKEAGSRGRGNRPSVRRPLTGVTSTTTSTTSKPEGGATTAPETDVDEESTTPGYDSKTDDIADSALGENEETSEQTSTLAVVGKVDVNKIYFTTAVPEVDETEDTGSPSSPSQESAESGTTGKPLDPIRQAVYEVLGDDVIFGDKEEAAATTSSSTTEEVVETTTVTTTTARSSRRKSSRYRTSTSRPLTTTHPSTIQSLYERTRARPTPRYHHAEVPLPTVHIRPANSPAPRRPAPPSSRSRLNRLRERNRVREDEEEEGSAGEDSDAAKSSVHPTRVARPDSETLSTATPDPATTVPSTEDAITTTREAVDALPTPSPHEDTPSLKILETFSRMHEETFFPQGTTTPSTTTAASATSSPLHEDVHSGPEVVLVKEGRGTARHIPGAAGKGDRTPFRCTDKAMFRYYPDPDDVRIFHYCSPGFHDRQKLDFLFICDRMTRFNPQLQKCE